MSFTELFGHKMVKVNFLLIFVVYFSTRTTLRLELKCKITVCPSFLEANKKYITIFNEIDSNCIHFIRTENPRFIQ